MKSQAINSESKSDVYVAFRSLILFVITFLIGFVSLYSKEGNMSEVLPFLPIRGESFILFLFRSSRFEFLWILLLFVSAFTFFCNAAIYLLTLSVGFIFGVYFSSSVTSVKNHLQLLVYSVFLIAYLITYFVFTYKTSNANSAFVKYKFIDNEKSGFFVAPPVKEYASCFLKTFLICALTRIFYCALIIIL